MILFVLVMIVGGALIAAYVVSATHNQLMALDERCESAFADVDAQLKHRHNLIPNLVETVRGFAGHERDVLTEVTRARASASSRGAEHAARG